MNEAAVALSRRVPAQHALETPAPRRTFQAEVLDGVDAYETLRPDWQRLAERSGGATFFQTPEFLSAWARHFAGGRRLVTLVVREDREPVMIWPLAVERHALFRVARGAGTPIGQYDELLIDPAANAAAALRAALDGLRAAVRPDLVLLERVRADGPLRAALGDTAPFGTSEGAPYVDLSRGMATALAGLKPAVAKKQRKRVRRFRKEGEVAFAVADDPETAQKWLGEALTLKRGWLKDTGRISRAFVRTGSGHCLSELASDLFGSGPAPRMIVAKLTLEGNAGRLRGRLSP